LLRQLAFGSVIAWLNNLSVRPSLSGLLVLAIVFHHSAWLCLQLVFPSAFVHCLSSLTLSIGQLAFWFGSLVITWSSSLFVIQFLFSIVHCHIFAHCLGSSARPSANHWLVWLNWVSLYCQLLINFNNYHWLSSLPGWLSSLLHCHFRHPSFAFVLHCLFVWPLSSVFTVQLAVRSLAH